MVAIKIEPFLLLIWLRLTHRQAESNQGKKGLVYTLVQSAGQVPWYGHIHKFGVWKIQSIHDFDEVLF